MTIYFAGSETDSFVSTGATATTASTFDALYSRLSQSISGAQIITITLPSEVGANSADGWWFHGRAYSNVAATSIDNETFLLAKDGSGNNVVYSSTVNDAAFEFTVYGSGGATGISNTWSSGWGLATLCMFDLHVYTLAGVAHLDVYANAALVASATVAETNRGIKTIILGSTSATASSLFWSEFLIADTDTRHLRVITAVPSGNGTYTSSPGTFSDIAESATDTANITINAVGDKESWTVTRTGTPGTAAVVAVALNGILFSDNTNDLQALVRVAGSDYTSTDLGLTSTAKPTFAVWNTNPATGGAWGVETNINSVEFGYQAVA